MAEQDPLNSSDHTDPLSYFKTRWAQEQLALKQKLITKNTVDPSTLKYVAGVDLSFIKDNSDDACAALVVLSYPELKVVYQQYKMVKLTLPYISGFLAFREVDHLVNLIDELRSTKPELMPGVIMCDGNGQLHPLGFGLACHLGVLVDIPTIGIAKTFLMVDGMDAKVIRSRVESECKEAGDTLSLVGQSGTMWGYALCNNPGGKRPMYVSAGHMLSQENALELVKKTSTFRIPEPIRAADLGSREYLRKLGKTAKD